MSEVSEIIDKVTETVQPILDENNFYLYSIEYVQEGGSWYLRVFIDKDNGISIDDCVLVSDQLSEKLDEIDPDPFADQYFLEVSSPGAERPLNNEQDYQNAINDYVNVSLYQKLDGKKMYEGTLKELNDDDLTLIVKDKTRRKEVKIPRKLISKARLAIEF
ncbi:ribosome maturation factor RimP [Fructilactobacillus sanfranciscensis]|uniref:ribosome maturation factor RimP n=1 Tax=Fructilactobacillus sanfranciscensis TaxID=1625 RepID=UPI00111987AF|nr:ribosome maturation factor RimP [Fructilactobacillus sanfranciscensis]TNL02073.1 ribosome maturation factor RimP [Fructilactobacillus sanfranciscensis]